MPRRCFRSVRARAKGCRAPTAARRSIPRCIARKGRSPTPPSGQASKSSRYPAIGPVRLGERRDSRRCPRTPRPRLKPLRSPRSLRRILRVGVAAFHQGPRLVAVCDFDGPLVASLGATKAFFRKDGVHYSPARLASVFVRDDDLDLRHSIARRQAAEDHGENGEKRDREYKRHQQRDAISAQLQPGDPE